MNRSQRIIAFAALAMILCAAPAWACPSCQAALEADGGRYVNALFWSILFMLSMPFLLLGSFGLYFYYLVRKARRPAGAEA